MPKRTDPTSHPSDRRRVLLARGAPLALAALLVAVPFAAARVAAMDVDLTALSLEELMDVEVTSVSKRSQRLADVAAAVFVIGQEDIRTSGATNIPELLRMVPGVEVARIDANKWAVSIRDFNARFANKLLVLIDGRSVYNPLFSSVFWDVYDLVLEDIERIEVIRGPGATMWGANAVNGVVNIITKSAKDTQGVLLSGGGGTEQRAFGTARYGGQVGEDLYYRGYFKAAKVDDAALASGDDAADGFHQGRSGFRLDWEPGDKDSLTLAGDLYRLDNGTTGASHPLFVPPYLATWDDRGEAKGGSLLARWDRALANDANIGVQASYERFKRDEQGTGGVSDVAELDVQHDFSPFSGHRVVWGLGYRFTHTDLDRTVWMRPSPAERSDSLYSAFVQDEISLIADQLRLTLGSKFEHNEATGFEIQPTARFLWSPSPRHSLWGAVSRAVRTPSISERDADLTAAIIPPGTPANPGPLPVEVAVFGDDDIASEELIAFELGYRTTVVPDVSLDIATFYNVYDNLRRHIPGGAPFFAPAPVPRLVVPQVPDASGNGTTYGVEVAADWTVLPWWQVRAAYAYLHTAVDDDVIDGHASPSHQASLRSLMDLGGGWQLDLWPRYVDNLPRLGIESYFDLDVRLAWRPSETVEFAVVGQNLLDSRREEFSPEFGSLTPTQVERGVYAKFTLTF